MPYNQRQVELLRLARLCLEERELTDAELLEIESASEKLISLFYRMALFASGVQRHIHARKRRTELKVLPTEKLQSMYDQIIAAQKRAIAEDEFDEEPDSLYETATFDSDEHLLSEILKERQQPAVA